MTLIFSLPHGRIMVDDAAFLKILRREVTHVFVESSRGEVR